jgi:uridine phosphorylase
MIGFDQTNIILNSDGSIYHLGLFPRELNDIVLTVGDPERVFSISRHFDSISLKKQKREFLINNGVYNGINISVISTGMGTDNIDIVLNELDILANMNLKTGKPNDKLRSLKIIRVGTSAAIQEDIKTGTIILSGKAVGFDNMMHFYSYSNELNRSLISNLKNHLKDFEDFVKPYVFNSDSYLLDKFSKMFTQTGTTITNPGFYGPQSRFIRIPLKFPDLNTKLRSFNYRGERITNLDMETSGLYGLSELLGHKCISINAILANRITHIFSKKPNLIIDNMIEQTLITVLSI